MDALQRKNGLWRHFRERKRRDLRQRNDSGGVKILKIAKKSLTNRRSGGKIIKQLNFAYLAQSVEHAAVNRRVVGSSPSVGAMISDEIAVTNKKDGFYANPPFLLQFFRII